MKDAASYKHRALTGRIEKALRQWGVQAGDAVVVGVSGGPDSVCLLHLLKAVSESFPLRLHVAHVEHGLRGQASMEDARFVEDLARDWKIPVTVRSVSGTALSGQPRKSIQMAAREVRFAMFRELAQHTGSRWVALGHTADDQAETFLLRLLRGAGPQGLGSIPPIRKGDATGAVPHNIIRPILDLRRREILAYLNSQSIPYREDCTNQQDDYLRNRVRHRLLPMLVSQFNPRLVESLCQMADLFGEDQAWMRRQSSAALGRIRIPEGEPDSVLTMRRREFLNFPLPIQRGVLRAAIEQIRGNLLGITYDHIEKIRFLVRDGGTGQSLHLPKELRVQLIYDRFCLLLGAMDPDDLGLVELPVPGEILLSSRGLTFKASLQSTSPEHMVPGHAMFQAAFDFSQICFPLILRTRRPGDYFYPPGLRGRKKLQDFFVDLKIPRHERDRIVLLTSSQGILWIIGWRLDQRFAARPKSSRAVVVEVNRCAK